MVPAGKLPPANMDLPVSFSYLREPLWRMYSETFCIGLFAPRRANTENLGGLELLTVAGYGSRQ